MKVSVETPFVDAPKATTVRPSYVISLDWFGLSWLLTVCSTVRWSPEGTHIATPNSMSGKVFVAGVVERITWKSDISMVGHEDMVTSTAFNPLLFLRDPTQPVSGSNMSTIIALASRNEISFWSTSQSQPFLVLNDVFERDVLDLSWSKDGLQLWACSSEGHVAALIFSLDEFPTLAPPGTKEAHHATFGFKRRINLAPAGTTPLSAMFGSQTGATVDKPNVLIARKGPGAKRPRAQLTTQAPAPIQNGNGEMSAFQAAAAQAQVLPAAAAYAAHKLQPPPQPSNSAAGFANLLNHPQQPTLPLAPQHGAIHQDGPLYYDPSRLSQAEYRLAGTTLGSGRQVGPPKERYTIRPSYLPKEKEPGFELSHKHDGAGGSRALAVPAVQTYGSVQVVDGQDQDTFEYRNFGAGARAAEVGVVADGKSLWVDFLNSHVVLATGSPVFLAVSTEDNSLLVYSPTGRRLFPNIVLDSPCAFLVAEGQFLMAITARGSLTVYDVIKVAAVVPQHNLTSLLKSAAHDSVTTPTVTSAGLQPNGIPVLALDSGASFAYHHSLSAWSRLSELWWRENSDAWGDPRAYSSVGGKGAVLTIEAAIDAIAGKGKHRAGQDGDDSIIIDGEEGDRPAKRARIELVGEEKAPLGKEETFRFAVTLAHLETRLHAAELLKSSAEYKANLLTYAAKLAEEGLTSKATELINELLGPKYLSVKSRLAKSDVAQACADVSHCRRLQQPKQEVSVGVGCLRDPEARPAPRRSRHLR